MTLRAFSTGLAFAGALLACGPRPEPAATVEVPIQGVPRGSAPLAVDPPAPSSTPVARATGPFTWHSCSEEGSLRSQVSDVSLDMTLVNGTREDLTMIWLEFVGGRRVEYATIPAGHSYEQQTYVTHPWLVLGEDGRCLGIFVPNEAGKHLVRLTRPPLAR